MIKYLILTILLVLFFKKSKAMKNNVEKSPQFDPSDENYIKKAFDRLRQSYNDDVAKQVERIYRLETAHFKSGQYLASLSPGMLYSKDGVVFSWTNLDKYGVTGHTKTYSINGHEFQYIVFPSLYMGLKYLADYINRHGGNYARWFSTNPDEQNQYTQLLADINTKYT